MFCTAALKVKAPSSLDMHVAIVNVIQKLMADLVNTKLLKCIKDNAKLFLTVLIFRTNYPPSLRLPQAVKDKSTGLNLFASQQSFAPAAAITEHPMSMIVVMDRRLPEVWFILSFLKPLCFIENSPR